MGRGGRYSRTESLGAHTHLSARVRVILRLTPTRTCSSWDSARCADRPSVSLMWVTWNVGAEKRLWPWVTGKCWRAMSVVQALPL